MGGQKYFKLKEKKYKKEHLKESFNSPDGINCLSIFHKTAFLMFQGKRLAMNRFKQMSTYNVKFRVQE